MFRDIWPNRKDFKAPGLKILSMKNKKMLYQYSLIFQK